jgi:hypothetical protein
MPLLLLPVALALIAAVAAALPSGRRLIATAIDMVDGSVALFTIRRALGRDTTTARQRRIDRRLAREQSELERRIGASAVTSTAVPSPVAPNRLVASGDWNAAGLPPDERSALTLRNATRAVLVVLLVVVAFSYRFAEPTGAVLEATATPRDRTGVARASASPPAPRASVPAAISSPAPTSTPAGRPTATPASTETPPATPAPVVAELSKRLLGPTAGGRTVGVRLSWDLAPGSVAASGFVVSVRVDDGGFEPVATLDGEARRLDTRLGIERTSVFRIRAWGPDESTATETDWVPITPGRHQETSRLVTLKGRWRDAAGPSLSGGGVVFSPQRGAAATFRFTGTDVGWVATRTPMSGQAEVRIDGDVVDTIDLAAGSVRYRELVFRWHAASRVAHVLEIRPLGDGRVDIDAFVVLR